MHANTAHHHYRMQYHSASTARTRGMDTYLLLAVHSRYCSELHLADQRMMASVLVWILLLNKKCWVLELVLGQVQQCYRLNPAQPLLVPQTCGIGAKTRTSSACTAVCCVVHASTCARHAHKRFGLQMALAYHVSSSGLFTLLPACTTRASAMQSIPCFMRPC